MHATKNHYYRYRTISKRIVQCLFTFEKSFFPIHKILTLRVNVRSSDKMSFMMVSQKVLQKFVYIFIVFFCLFFVDFFVSSLPPPLIYYVSLFMFDKMTAPLKALLLPCLLLRRKSRRFCSKSRTETETGTERETETETQRYPTLFLRFLQFEQFKGGNLND